MWGPNRVVKSPPSAFAGTAGIGSELAAHHYPDRLNHGSRGAPGKVWFVVRGLGTRLLVITAAYTINMYDREYTTVLCEEHTQTPCLALGDLFRVVEGLPCAPFR